MTFIMNKVICSRKKENENVFKISPLFIELIPLNVLTFIKSKLYPNDTKDQFFSLVYLKVYI